MSSQRINNKYLLKKKPLTFPNDRWIVKIVHRPPRMDSQCSQSTLTIMSRWSSFTYAISEPNSHKITKKIALNQLFPREITKNWKVLPNRQFPKKKKKKIGTDMCVLMRNIEIFSFKSHHTHDMCTPDRDTYPQMTPFSTIIYGTSTGQDGHH